MPQTAAASPECSAQDRFIRTPYPPDLPYRRLPLRRSIQQTHVYPIGLGQRIMQSIRRNASHSAKREFVPVCARATASLPNQESAWQLEMA